MIPGWSAQIGAYPDRVQSFGGIQRPKNINTEHNNNYHEKILSPKKIKDPLLDPEITLKKTQGLNLWNLIYQPKINDI